MRHSSHFKGFMQALRVTLVMCTWPHSMGGESSSVSKSVLLNFKSPEVQEMLRENNQPFSQRLQKQKLQ